MLFFGIVTTGLRPGYSSRTVPGSKSLSFLSSSVSKSTGMTGIGFFVVVLVVVVKRLLVRTEVDVFLDGCDGRVLVRVVAGTVGVDTRIVAVSSSTQFEIGPLHCPVAVQVMKFGPSSL